jgi:hypothetical protein
MSFMKSDMVAVLLVGGALAVTPTIGLAPARQTRLDAAALRAEAESLRKELEETQSATARVRGAIEHERQILAALSSESVGRIPLNRRIAMVNGVAERCGLEVTRLSPRREQDRNGAEPVRGLAFSAMGSFGGVVRLLEELETPELALWAQSFEIVARQDRQGWVTITTDISWHADSAGD